MASKEDKFVYVTDRTMIDPVHKIILSRGRFDLDGPPYTQTIRVEYDPNLRTDALADHRPVEAGAGSSTSLFNLLFETFPNDPVGKLRVQFNTEDFNLYALIISQRVPSLSKDEAMSLCIDLLKASTRMRAWDEIAWSWNTNPPNAKRQLLKVDFLIKQQLADWIGDAFPDRFEQASNGLYVLASREVES